MNPFDKRVESATEERLLLSRDIRIIQVNVGLRCNQQCAHCHLDAGPKRAEQMSWETMEQVLAAARCADTELVDVTGGAPEMNPHFRRFVAVLRDENFAVQVRTNLTILVQPGFEEVAPFMACRGVGLVASLPCYLEQNVDTQRGRGAYKASIQALRMLNQLGYGIRDDLPLDLVYNPAGAVLPPNQTELEADYRRELGERFGIQFTRLRTITNILIGRFDSALRQKETEQPYQQMLEEAFNPRTLDGLMCRRQISVDWNGTMHDCDFNLALNLPVSSGSSKHIGDFDPETLSQRRIVTGAHCFACTAGFGSSCGGALVPS